MHHIQNSILLPSVFQCKTNLVKVLKPKVILLDFHGTISERRWEDRVIFPYVKRALNSYLINNWMNDMVQGCIPGLKSESFEQRFRNKHEDVPVIDDQIEGDPMQLALQLSEFIGWQMSSKRETKETQIIERLVWLDGMRKQQILTPLYEDVMPTIKLWHDRYACSIYIISSIDSSTLKLLFENTDKGNLDKYLAGYVSSSKMGGKLMNETYQNFKERLKESKERPGGATPGQILFLTDSGQEAKAATSLDDGTSFECVLVSRPGNKRLRSYYVTKFQCISKLDDLVFVEEN